MSADDTIVPGDYVLTYKYVLQDKIDNPTINTVDRDVKIVDCRAFITTDSMTTTTTVKGDPGYAIVTFLDYLGASWTDPLALN